MPNVSSITTFLRTEPAISPFLEALNLKTGIGVDYSKSLRDIYKGDVNFNSTQNTWNLAGVAVSTTSALQAVYESDNFKNLAVGDKLGLKNGTVDNQLSNNYEIVAKSPLNSSDYQGVLVRNLTTGQYTFINRGTQELIPDAN